VAPPIAIGAQSRKSELFNWAANYLKELSRQFDKGVRVRGLDILKAAGALEIVGMKLGSRMSECGRWRLASFSFPSVAALRVPVEVLARSTQYCRRRHDIARYTQDCHPLFPTRRTVRAGERGRHRDRRSREGDANPNHHTEE